MWLATVRGWFSVVWKGGTFHVRARDEQDLQNLRQAAGLDDVVILIGAGTDYQARMLVNADQLARIFTALAADITYDNFKSEVARRPDQRRKLHAYHEMWSLMAEVADDPANRRRPG